MTRPSLEPSPQYTLLDHLRRIRRDLRVHRLLLMLTFLPAAWVPDTAAGGLLNGPATRPATGAYIIHVPGIAGPMRIDRRLAQGVLEGGSADGTVAEVEIFDWVGRRRGLPAVYGREENLRQARRLAERIVRLKREQPERPVIITAHSGGTAITAWALEVLPEVARDEEATDTDGPQSVAVGGRMHGKGDASDEEARQDDNPSVKVNGVVMLASGLSNDYDLSRALRAVDGPVFHLSSHDDNLILGAGTLIFGTLDGIHGYAAGKTGFHLPAGVAADLYANFIEIPYDPAWTALGHYGDHEGMMSRLFGTQVIADVIRYALGDTSISLPTTRPTTRRGR